MSKILIVEDNQLARQGLCENVKWYENGIEIIAAVENGQEALACIKLNKPDIVITDIIMPFMTGLELAEEILKLYQDIKIIILTAYNEFEYAQKAIKANVFDYLLKPVDYSHLLDTTMNALKEIAKENEIIDQIKKSLPILRENFLIRLAEGFLDHEAMMQEALYLDLQFNNLFYTSILLEFDNSKELRNEIGTNRYQINLYKAMDIVYEELKDMSVWGFQDKNGCLCFIIGFNREEGSIQYELYSKLESIKANILKRCMLITTIGIGCSVNRIEQIEISCQNAKQALDIKFLMGNNQIFFMSDLKALGTSQNEYYPYSIEEHIISKVKTIDHQGVSKCIKQIKEYFKNNYFNKRHCYIVVLGIYMKCVQVLCEIGVKDEDIVDLKINQFKDVESYSTLEEILMWFETALLNICNIIELTRIKGHQNILEHVRNYIKEKYCKEDLGLVEISKHVALSPSYLSAVFKKEMDITLSDYIISMRMEKAKELLCQTDLKINEIGISVGYNNPYYFSSSFKKYSGTSPSQYKIQIRDTSKQRQV